MQYVPQVSRKESTILEFFAGSALIPPITSQRPSRSKKHGARDVIRYCLWAMRMVKITDHICHHNLYLRTFFLSDPSLPAINLTTNSRYNGLWAKTKAAFHLIYKQHLWVDLLSLKLSWFFDDLFFQGRCRLVPEGWWRYLHCHGQPQSFPEHARYRRPVAVWM